MKAIRKHLLSAGVACLSCLPLSSNLVAADAPAASGAGATAPQPSAESMAAMIAASGGNWQMVLDTLLEQQAKPAGDSASKEAHSPEQLGREIDGLLAAAEKARTADKPEAFYAAQWKLLRVLPELATRTTAARAKIAGTSDAVKKFLKDVDGPLTHLTETYQRFREKLGIRSAQVDQAAQKMGFKGAVDVTKSAPAEGEIVLKADPAAAKPTVTAAEKAKIAGLESALVKLLGADTKKIPDGYSALWLDVTKALECGWYFQTLYKADPKIGEADPETLKFLRSLNHGLGDLSRYDSLAQQMGWDLNQLDTPADVAADAGTAAAPAGAVAEAGNAAMTATSAADTTTTAPAPAAGGATADATVNADTPAAKSGAGADDWQAKLDAQLKKDEPAAKPAATGDKVTLDKSTQQIAANIQKATESIQAAKQDKSAKNARDYFKGQWQLMRQLPEVAYKTPETRKALEGENEETKAFLKANEATTKAVSDLFLRFKQRLGLRSSKVDQMAKRMGVKGNVDETKGASNTSGNGDISLDAPDPKAANANAAQNISAAERYKMQVLETYLKRLAMEEGKGDTANAENDFKEATKNLDGAYFFQVLYKANPAVGAQYPEILKFLQSLNGGLGDLRAYQNLMEQNGWTIDDNGELVRGDGGGDNPPDANQAAPTGGWRGGGGGGGGKGGRGGRGR
ncbi:MAG TPA: hypothetical protein VL860_03915 [Planctomycetota bacterium]|nr:hypothetical protein [Planctomycetota bacterium]